MGSKATVYRVVIYYFMSDATVYRDGGVLLFLVFSNAMVYRGGGFTIF